MVKPKWDVDGCLESIQAGRPVETGACIVRDGETGGRPDLYRNLFGDHPLTPPFICTRPKELNETGYRALKEHIGSKRVFLLMEATRRKHFFTAEMLFSVLQNRLRFGIPDFDWKNFLPVLVVNKDWVYEAEPDRLGLIRSEADSRKVLRLETTDKTLEADLIALRRTISSGILTGPLYRPEPRKELQEVA